MKIAYIMIGTAIAIGIAVFAYIAWDMNNINKTRITARLEELKSRIEKLEEKDAINNKMDKS